MVCVRDQKQVYFITKERSLRSIFEHAQFCVCVCVFYILSTHGDPGHFQYYYIIIQYFN